MGKPSESPPPYSGPGPRMRRLLPVLVRAVCALPVFLVNIPLVEEAARLGHDASWRKAYAHFFKEGYQAGVDYAFTLGPYGYFLSPHFDPELYGLNLAVQTVLTFALAIVFVEVAARAKTLPGCLAAYGFALVLIPFAGRGAQLFLGLAAIAFVLSKSFRGRWAALVLLEGVMAFIALIKFGQFIVAALCLGAVALVIARQEGWRRGALIPSIYLGWLVALWLVAGQGLTNVPAYVASALDIGAAYNQTMTLPGPAWEIAIAIALAAMLATAWGLCLWRAPRSLDAWIFPALFAALLVLLWKSGFVRQIGHSRQFFAMAAFAALLVDWNRVAQPLRRRVTVTVCVGAFLIAATALTFASRNKPYEPAAVPAEWARLLITNTQPLLSPGDERERLVQARRYLRVSNDLPEIREAVGDGSVDILPHTQGVVLINELNYHPRPVFQGYQAGTTKLTQRNAAHFEGPDAPEFVLGWLTPIDQRYPTLEDSESIKTVLWNYTPQLTETPFELLRRVTPERGPLKIRDVADATHEDVFWGEWFEIDAQSDSWQLLRLTIPFASLGRLHEALYRPPFLYMETRFNDGDTARWRIHRSMAENAFILNPFLLTGDQMRAAYVGDSKRWVTALRLSIEGGTPLTYDSTVGIELRTIAPLTQKTQTFESAPSASPR